MKHSKGRGSRCARREPGPAPPDPVPYLVVIPADRVRQADGAWLIKPGWPVVVAQEISTRVAARILGLSQRRVETMIEEGKFRAGEEWSQPGGPGGKYLLKLDAVLARKQRAD